MNIEELLPDGHWATEEEYVIRCPWSDHDTHDHCYVNVVKQTFFCHYCEKCGSLKRLLHQCKVVGELEPRVGIIEKKRCDLIDFSQFAKVTGKSNVMDVLALSYLEERGLNKSEIEAYDIRFSNAGRFYGRVLLPIYENGRLVSFVGRSFIKCVKPKYLFPRTGETLLTCGEAIFGYQEAMKDFPFCAVITEGIFDAMAINRISNEKYFDKRLRGLAILSSHLSDGQLHKLLKLPMETMYIVLLDSDVHKKAVEIAKVLYDKYSRKHIKVALLEHGDPASVSKDELIGALKCAIQYSFELELKISVNDR